MRFNNNNDWGQRREDREDYATKDDWQSLRRIQMTVATSTFSVIAMMGMFCTCLYLGCCRQKRQTRQIRGGRTWNTDPSLAMPANGGMMMNYPLDPMHLNPYLINSNYYPDVNLNTSNGFYHPSVGIPDEKPPADSTYKPFFAKMDWQPPDPPSYHTLSFVNPVYNQERQQEKQQEQPEVVVVDNSNGQPTNDKITEKIVTNSLTTSDPTKRLSSDNPPPQNSYSQDWPVKFDKEDDDQTAGATGFENNASGGTFHDKDKTIGDPVKCSSTAPPESLVSLEAKDNGHPYPNGINASSITTTTTDTDEHRAKPGAPEEIVPPPYNPSYYTYQPK